MKNPKIRKKKILKINKSKEIEKSKKNQKLAKYLMKNRKKNREETVKLK